MSRLRTFELVFDVVVAEIPADTAALSFWAPFPRDATGQEVQGVEVESTIPYEILHDPVYGNAIAHATLQGGEVRPFSFRVVTRATRHELSARISGAESLVAAGSHHHWRPFLQEQRLVKFTPEISATAERIRGMNKPALAMAREVYEHVLATMSYDKSGEGWGQGSTEHACAIGKGNCTDFHSLFLGLMRACGIPAKFDIGVALPATAAGDITMFKCGYHCWASFHIHGIGWIPVDCSEAAQKPGLRDYYFGTIDENRFMLSTGRDIPLPGRRKPMPVNFFTEPIIENEVGSPLAYDKKLSFRDLP